MTRRPAFPGPTENLELFERAMSLISMLEVIIDESVAYPLACQSIHIRHDAWHIS
jgi:hypothetical protein